MYGIFRITYKIEDYDGKLGNTYGVIYSKMKPMFFKADGYPRPSMIWVPGFEKAQKGGENVRLFSDMKEAKKMRSEVKIANWKSGKDVDAEGEGIGVKYIVHEVYPNGQIKLTSKDLYMMEHLEIDEAWDDTYEAIGETIEFGDE